MAWSEKQRTVLSAIAVPVRVYLGLVFVFASVYKIAEPFEFALSVATYQILPLELVNPFTLALPMIELFVGLTLLLGFWTKESAALIAGMMLMFLVALVIALNQDLQISCGCFASQEAADEISTATIFRDLGWLSLALYTLFLDDGRFGLDGWMRKRRRHADKTA